jgi:predicted component of type VI protein secretion system
MIWVCLNKERVAVYKDYDAAFKFLIEARCPVAMEMKFQGKSTINSGAPIEHGHS